MPPLTEGKDQAAEPESQVQGNPLWDSRLLENFLLVLDATVERLAREKMTSEGVEALTSLRYTYTHFRQFLRTSRRTTFGPGLTFADQGDPPHVHLEVRESVWLKELAPGSLGWLQAHLGHQSARVRILENVATAREALERERPDAMILELGDVVSKGTLDLLAGLAAISPTTAVIVLCRPLASFHVAALQAIGVDEIMEWPWAASEVLGRLANCCSRIRLRTGQKCEYTSEMPLLDEAFRTYTYNGLSGKLTKSEFRILQVLLETPNRPVSLDTLARRALDYDPTIGGHGPIRTHIRNLRAKLDSTPDRPKRIRNLPGSGYLFALDQPD